MPPISRQHLLRLASCALVALALVVPGVASHAQTTGDAPARVGRVANVQGTLYHTPAGGGETWTPIGVNYPVAQGDNLWTEDDARAEVDYGGGQFRIAGATNLHVSRLDERQLALFVATGHLVVRVRYLDPGDDVRIDTPSPQIGLRRPGLYRVDVAASPAPTVLVVREGEADVATANGALAVYPGEMATLAGTAGVDADVARAGVLDAFDTWSAERDRVYEGRPDEYVSPQMVGQYELDAYGIWQTYPEYGPVWFPTVDPEWAPYRFGHWTWLRDYGYAWVDFAPWGYAPFHYGRWAYIGGRWGWCPGAYQRRPGWAPALVAWYGGTTWTYAVDGAPVYGWVPLGWGEAYVPPWRGCSSRCVARYNRPYHVDIARGTPEPPHRPVNWHSPGGLTAIAAPTLAGGRPVARNRVPVATDRVVPPALPASPPIAPQVERPGAIRPGGAVPPPAATIRVDDGRTILPPAAPPAPSRLVTRPVLAPTPPLSGERSLPAHPVPTPAAPLRPTAPPATVPATPAAPFRPVAPPAAVPAPPTLPLRPMAPPPSAPAPLRVPGTPLPGPVAPQAPAPIGPPRIAPPPAAAAPAPRPAPPAAPTPGPVAPQPG